MRFASPVAITGIGMMTPVGLTAPASCAAMRAGITRTAEIETHLVVGEGTRKQPLTGGRVPTEWFEGEPELEQWPGFERFGLPTPPPSWEYIAPGVERLVELALRPARECWEAAEAAALPPDRVGFYLAIGGGSPDDPLDSAELSDALQRELGVEFARVGVASDGRAGGLAAFQAAARHLQEGKIDAAFVGAVDSNLREPAVRMMEAAGMLRSSEQPTGVIPGEAAAFVLAETEAAARARGCDPLAVVVAGSYRQEASVAKGEPNTGTALTQVLGELRTDCPEITEHPLVVCDLNGDRYRASEWAYALLRALALDGEPALWHPAEYIGDAGAAMGLVNMAWAATAFAKNYAGKNHALLWGASDGPVRAGVVLAPAN